MRRSCTRCERTSPANTLFCHDFDCPAERSPVILEAGDRVGDIEIVRPITTVRSATVYEALQGELPVFMKVSHPGSANSDRLLREAKFLRSLGAEKKARYPTLPRLRAPYPTTTLDQDAIGTISVGRELIHYYLFEQVEGQSLHELLLQQPQWWVNHVGWLCVELALTINTLHLKGLYHCALTPSSVLVQFEAKPRVPHILLCDLGIASNAENLARDWYADVVPPAYRAPELIASGPTPLKAGVQSDVYGLGLVLYEMLVGEPVFADPLASESQVLEAVLHDERPRMSRVEDVSPVAEIALRASAASLEARTATAADVAEELIGVFGDSPKKSSRPGISLNFVLVLGGVALVMAFLITLAVTLSGQP